MLSKRPKISLLSTKVPTIVGTGETHFNMQALRWLENASLKLDFASKIFHKIII